MRGTATYNSDVSMITHINIHKRTAAVILGGGIFLSIISGLVIGAIELEFVDQTVLSLAVDESRSLQNSWETYFQSQDLKSKQLLQKEIQKRLEQDTFIFFEIYNADKERLIEMSLPGIENITAELEKRGHPFPMDGIEDSSLIDQIVNKIHPPVTIQGIKNISDYIWIYQDGQLYLKFIMPLVLKNGNTAGFFEGIYHVKKNKTDEIINRMILSVAQTFIAVFLSSLFLYPFILMLNRDLIRTSRSLVDANINTLNSLGSSIARRDSTTNSHNYRVTIYAVRLAEKMGFSSAQIRSLIKGAFLHDVGKVGVPDAILLKKGTLNKKEFTIMKNHVQYGLDIIQSNHWLADARDVVGHHHERYDGTGYPEGLRGKDISASARIFAIADVFDALTSERPYKNAVSPEETVKIMKKEKGRHFDPDMLDAFIKMITPLHSNILSFTSDEKLQKILSDQIGKYFFV